MNLFLIDLNGKNRLHRMSVQNLKRNLINFYYFLNTTKTHLITELSEIVKCFNITKTKKKVLIQRINEMQRPSTSTHLCSSVRGILCGYYFIGFKRNDKSLRSKIDSEQNLFYTGDCYCMIKIMEIRHKFIFT